jgi:hypothetical protein
MKAARIRRLSVCPRRLKFIWLFTSRWTTPGMRRPWWTTPGACRSLLHETSAAVSFFAICSLWTDVGGRSFGLFVLSAGVLILSLLTLFDKNIFLPSPRSSAHRHYHCPSHRGCRRGLRCEKGRSSAVPMPGCTSWCLLHTCCPFLPCPLRVSHFRAHLAWMRVVCSAAPLG